LNLRDIPIIDTHGHAFNPEKESGDFRAFFNQSLWYPDINIVKHTLINYKMIRELKEKFALPLQLDQDEVVSIRNKQYKENPKEYVSRLMGDLKIDTIVIDTGFPNKKTVGYDPDMNDFAKLMGAKVKSVHRIDQDINQIIKLHPRTYSEARELFEYELDLVIKKNDIVGLKSYIAYETGLDIERYNDFEIKNAYDRYHTNINIRDKKIIYDSFNFIGLRKCKENDIVMQFHTGFGSPPALNVCKANPILLENILAEDEIRDVKVMFLHSGIPYSKEAAFLCSTFTNCYCDLSGIVVNFYSAYKKVLYDVLEYGSLKRITFGTDGLMVPETYYMGCLLGIDLLGEVLEEIVKSKYVSSSEAMDIGTMVINKNAKELFKI